MKNVESHYVEPIGYMKEYFDGLKMSNKLKFLEGFLEYVETFPVLEQQRKQNFMTLDIMRELAKENYNIE